MPTKEKIAEYAELLDSETLRPPVVRLLAKCAVTPHLSGFDLLADAVMLYSTGDFANLNEIYDAIAAIRAQSPRTIKRTIGYAVGSSASLPARLEQESGAKLPATVSTGCAVAYFSKTLSCNNYTILSPNKDH